MGKNHDAKVVEGYRCPRGSPPPWLVMAFSHSNSICALRPGVACVGWLAEMNILSPLFPGHPRSELGYDKPVREDREVLKDRRVWV